MAYAEQCTDGAQAAEGNLQLDKEGTELLHEIFEKLHLSARSYDRIIKVSRTIADLDGQPQILAKHVAEAISYRNMIPQR